MVSRNIKFKQLDHLMKTHGLKAPDLVRNMIKQGIIPSFPEDVDYVIKQAHQVREHLTGATSAAEISGDWINRYCQYFHCSADYLFGYIDHPTHAAATVTDLTGLTEAAANRLLSLSELNHVTGYTDVLSTLLESSFSLELVLKDLLRYFSYYGNTEAVNVQPDKDMNPLYMPLDNISEITLSHDLAILQKEAAVRYKGHPDFYSYDYYDESKRAAIEKRNREIMERYGDSPEEQLLAKLWIQYYDEKDLEEKKTIHQMIEGICRKLDLDEIQRNTKKEEIT